MARKTLKRYSVTKMTSSEFDRFGNKKDVMTVSVGYPFVNVYKKVGNKRVKVGRYNTSKNELQKIRK